MREWYYLKSNEQIGPVDERQLIQLLQDGAIAPETLVWTDTMTDWAEARTRDNLMRNAALSTTDTNDQIPIPEPPPVASDPSGPQVRPWVRYWARSIDYMLFGIVSGIFIGIIYESLLEVPDALFGVILAFLWVFLEPLCLATWGKTPGKALLKITVLKADQSKPTYNEALTRSFSVWLKGVGLGIPIVSLITQITAYNRLTKSGITSWDESGDFRVLHGKVGVLRSVIAVFFFIGVFFLLAASEM